MDPVSNTVSCIAGFFIKHGMCTEKASVSLAHQLLTDLTGEHGELEFTSTKRTPEGIEARQVALEHACALAKNDPGYFGMNNAEGVVATAEVFAKFLAGKGPNQKS